MKTLINYTKIIGYNDIFSVLENSLKQKKLPSKILLTGPKGIGKFTFAINFINFILSKDEQNSYDKSKFEINLENRSFKLMNNFVHPDFNHVTLRDGKKNIEIEQIREIIKYTHKSSFNNKKRFILIDNAELMSLNATNSLLKVVEEPTDNLHFIIIHDNSKKILDTIRSRCIIFKKNFTQSEIKDIFEKLTNSDFNQIFHNCYLKYYFSISDFIFMKEFSEKNSLTLKAEGFNEIISFLVSKKDYKKDLINLNLILKLIQCHFLESFKKNKNIYFYNYYQNFIKKINDTLRYNLDLESLFFEFEDKYL